MKLLKYLLIFIVGVSFSQIPPGYYSSATGTGFTLKTQLYNIIKDHNDQGYSALWTLYGTSDRDIFYENDNTILDIYSENPTGADPYNFTYASSQCGTYTNEGDCYNREHIIPQSYFGSANPMRNDGHFVLPTDGKVNAWRDDFPYGRVGSVSTSYCNTGATNRPCHTLNGSKLGNNMNSGYSSGSSVVVFEPIDEFKGDIARIMFYFVTRYENLLTTFFTSSSTTFKNMMLNNNTTCFHPTFLNILLTWHLMDPVSPKEVQRNNAVYAFQNNRNPFVDHPEFVQQIWGSPLNIDDAEFSSKKIVQIVNLPLGGLKIKSEAPFNRVQLFDFSGRLCADYSIQEGVEVDIPFQTEGVFILKVSGKSFENNQKVLLKN